MQLFHTMVSRGGVSVRDLAFKIPFNSFNTYVYLSYVIHEHIWIMSLFACLQREVSRSQHLDDITSELTKQRYFVLLHTSLPVPRSETIKPYDRITTNKYNIQARLVIANIYWRKLLCSASKRQTAPGCGTQSHNFCDIVSIFCWILCARCKW